MGDLTAQNALAQKVYAAKDALNAAIREADRAGVRCYLVALTGMEGRDEKGYPSVEVRASVDLPPG